MSTTLDTIPDVCPELGIEVPVSAIDRELRKLWEQDDAQTNASPVLARSKHSTWPLASPPKLPPEDFSNSNT